MDNVFKTSRRQWLQQLAALGAGSSLVRFTELGAQAPQSPRRLDLHHHFGSPRWIKRLVEVKRQGWQQFEAYTPARAVAAMDAAGVSTAFVSCTEPGVWFGDDFAKERQEAISLARDMNEYGARMVGDYKGRFGLFAVLPLPDVDASLKEIAYAFDTLKADGVGLLTSYGTVWLGDPTLQPVFDELNRPAPWSIRIRPTRPVAMRSWQTRVRAPSSGRRTPREPSSTSSTTTAVGRARRRGIRTSASS